MVPDLPVASVLTRIVAAARGGAVVVTAPPGSGKTTLVPAALLDDMPSSEKVILLQPRRLAARAVAHRIAALRGARVGREVGYQVRFDARVSRETRLVVETTGIMLRRLIDDIALAGIAAVVLDEFHERSLEMDLVLGLLVRLRQTVRPDLRVVVMSATLAAEPVAALLGTTMASAGACPVISAQGTTFPVDVRYLQHGRRRELVDDVLDAVQKALRETSGHVLVFLPGVGEIRRVETELSPHAARLGHAVLPLFGDLPPEDQDRVIDDIGSRKIILATNVAETSITIPGVTAVVDSGLARQARVSAATGLPHLALIPIARSAADQRAGRAGRTEPGICWRLWDEASHQHRPASEPPEALREDLSGALLKLLALAESEEFPWLDRAPPESFERAIAILRQLGATRREANDRERITPLGETLAAIPAHPRLARLLVAGAERGVLREAAIAAALLSERDPFRMPRAESGPRDRQTRRTRSDLVDRVRAIEAFAAHRSSADLGLDPHPAGAMAVLRAAEQLAGLVSDMSARPPEDPGTALMRALLDAFPDRLTRQRQGSQDRGTLVGGRGVRLTSSRLRGEPLFLAIDVHDVGSEAEVRVASAIDRTWLDEEPLASANLRTTDELLWHPTRKQVEARRRTSWIDLVLDEAPVAIHDRATAEAMLAEEAKGDLSRILPDEDSAAGAFLRRARWVAGNVPDVGVPLLDDEAVIALLPNVCHGRRSFDELRGADWLTCFHAAIGYGCVAEIDHLAPTHLEIKGKRHRLVYEPGKPPVLAIKIQELFGIRDTPRIANGRIPVLLHLLGPNHRPQQVTDDLAGFWERTYPQVRKDLRGRYPKHGWPEDPLESQSGRNA